MSDVALAQDLRDRAGSGATLLGTTLDEARSRGVTQLAWRENQRQEAIALLEAAGFPTQNDEAWRFTPTRLLTRFPFSRQGAPRVVGTLPPLPDFAGPRVVLVNGVPAEGLVAAAGAAAEHPAGWNSAVELHSLKAILETDPNRIAPYLGAVASVGDGFSAQNAATFEDGLVVFVKPGASGTLQLIHVAAPGNEPTLSTPRVLVVAESGSELVLFETHVAAAGEQHLENSVTELAVGENARVEHLRVHHGSAHARILGTIAVKQARDSRYVSRIFTFGGLLTRVDVNVVFDGAGAECVLDGLYLSHSDEIVDHHTVVDHAAPRCTSRERYKGIVDGNGLAVFDGTVFVRPGADKTEAHQENRNLLLSNDAVIHTKPHLEIDTDDVKCSHGATVGKLDKNQLFYLQSRGMDARLARSLLVYAFAREMAMPIADVAVRAAVEAAIARLLPDGDRVEELA